MLRCERCGLVSAHIYDGLCSDCLSELLADSESQTVVELCSKAHTQIELLAERSIKRNLIGK